MKKIISLFCAVILGSLLAGCAAQDALRDAQAEKIQAKIDEADAVKEAAKQAKIKKLHDLEEQPAPASPLSNDLKPRKQGATKVPVINGMPQVPAIPSLIPGGRVSAPNTPAPPAQSSSVTPAPMKQAAPTLSQARPIQPILHKRALSKIATQTSTKPAMSKTAKSTTIKIASGKKAKPTSSLSVSSKKVTQTLSKSASSKKAKPASSMSVSKKVTQTARKTASSQKVTQTSSKLVTSKKVTQTANKFISSKKVRQTLSKSALSQKNKLALSQSASSKKTILASSKPPQAKLALNKPYTSPASGDTHTAP
jgi:hypothetical protein